MSTPAMENVEGAKARLSRMEGRISTLRRFLGEDGRAVLSELQADGSGLREAIEAPERRARAAHDLQLRREAEAERLYGIYKQDAPGDVEDEDGWLAGLHDMSRRVYLLAGMGEPSVAVTFSVRFTPDSAEVESYGATEPDSPVIKSSFSMEM